MTLCILLLTQLLIIFGKRTGFSQKLNGICYSDSVGYGMCCLNFELIDNTCKECEGGYYRNPTAKRCEPCPSNLYGKKCAFLCNCKENERCDSIIGTCIPRTSTIGKLSEYSTILQLKDTTNNEPTDASVIRELTGVDWQTITYIMIGVLMIFGNIICLYAVYMKSKNNTTSVIGGSVTLTNQPSSSSQVPTVPNDTEIGIHILDHDYEEIDEIDEIHIVNASFHSHTNRHESETDSNSASTISPTEDDEGYLHPYHSLVHLKKMENFASNGQHSETDLRANVLLQNPYDHLQIPIKISTTSGYESMEMKERLPTSSNKSGQKHVVENTVDKSCCLDDTNIRIYAAVKRKNQPSQQDQINRLP